MSVIASNYFGDTMPQAQAGPLGLLIVILLGVGLWLLIRSMNKRFRGMTTRFDPERAEALHRGEPDPGPTPRASDDAPEVTDRLIAGTAPSNTAAKPGTSTRARARQAGKPGNRQSAKRRR